MWRNRWIFHMCAVASLIRENGYSCTAMATNWDVMMLSRLGRCTLILWIIVHGFSDVTGHCMEDSDSVLDEGRFVVCTCLLDVVFFKFEE